MLVVSALGIGPVSQPQFSNLFHRGEMGEEEIFLYPIVFFFLVGLIIKSM